MLATLIESRPHRQTRRGSAALSAIVHLTLITGAVSATLPHDRGVAAPPRVRPDSVIWIEPGPPARPVAHPATAAHCDLCIAPPPLPRFDPRPVTITTAPAPSLNFDSIATAASAPSGTRSGPLVDNPLAHGSGVGSGTGVFTPSQVERAVAVIGTVRPGYPEMLRAAGVEGRVVVRFVVDTTGRVEPGSIAIVESAHALFERSVREVLPRLRFAPAEAAGHHVRQLVEMPFQFSLSNR